MKYLAVNHTLQFLTIYIKTIDEQYVLFKSLEVLL